MNTPEKLRWTFLGFVTGFAAGSWRLKRPNIAADGPHEAVSRTLSHGWGVIGQQHPRFVAVLSNLLLSLRGLGDRTVRTHTPANRLVFTMSQIAVEDFMQILYLCAHGFGIGGLQILRSLSERTVTMVYISHNPDEADTFFAYHPINQRKVLNHARELGQLPLLRLSEENIKEIEEQYKISKPNFEETLCKSCGTKRVRFSWSNLDLASMARKADEGLRDLYTSLYLYPTLHAHATVPSVLSRIEMTRAGSFRYNAEAQPEHVRASLIGGHTLILRVFDRVNGHFSLGLDEELGQRVADFRKAWPDPTK